MRVHQDRASPGQDPRPTVPKKQAKSKYTADRGIPGAFEGETVTRRRFMVGTAHATGAIATSAILLPALGFALGPLFEEHEVRWQPVGTPDEFPDDTYVPKVITVVDGIGESGKTTVYVRKRNAEIDTDELAQGLRGRAVRRDLHALHAPRLPGPLHRGRAALHLPVPRRRLRLPGQGRRRPAGPPAGPLLQPRAQRPARDRPALLGQQRAQALLAAQPGRAARRHRRSTCTRRGRRSASSTAPPD